MVPYARSVSMRHNRIGSIFGASDALKFLDLTDNVSINVKDISAATSLQICVLRNCHTTEPMYYQSLKEALYMDLYNTGLMGADLEFIRECAHLLYLNVGCNMYKRVPTIPLSMLRELDLSNNDFEYVLNIVCCNNPHKNRVFKLESWCPMLRVLRLEDCKIQKIHPLLSAPFLQEIRLKGNELQNLESLMPLGVCENLQKIDVTGNPCAMHEQLGLFKRLLFPKINVIFQAAL